MGYHGLMRIAFCGMHKQPASSIGQVFYQGQVETTELLPATALVDDITEPELYQKALRIKSFKTYQWLCQEASVFHLLVCAITNSALEHIMHTFMLWQRDDFWLVEGKSPLILMANIALSPATRACKQLHLLMTQDLCSIDTLFPLDAIVKGCSDFDFQILP